MIDLKIFPNSPGCYLFKDSSAKIIYIGKAKDLKKRVSSYFSKKVHDVKTKALVEKISSADFIVTGTEVEALILESNLIKKHKPKYNIDLKDSKKYAYITLTKEEYPRLMILRDTRLQSPEKGELFGPFVSGEARDMILEFLRRTFHVRTCKKMPKKSCLRYHIGLCLAPCESRISKEDYLKDIGSVRLILKGKTKELSTRLEKEMKSAAQKNDFEKALFLRDQISSLEYLSEKQNMQRQKEYDEDIIGYSIREGKVYLMLFKIYKGTLEGREEYVFEDYSGFLSQFVTQYYSDGKVPKEIILPEEIDPSIAGFLSERRGSAVRIVVPKAGEKKQLLELVLKNIESVFFAGEKDMLELKKLLKLDTLPDTIECFDISHLSGTMTVASMVRFKGGIPDKQNYRRFRIRTVEGIDDFSSIAEVVRRRYQRLISEKKDFPDLIIIDGGKGQLSSAVSELSKLGIRIPVISIAKRFEEIHFPGLRFPIRPDRRSDALKLIQRIRDEAHRFAITYHKLLRRKKLTEKG